MSAILVQSHPNSYYSNKRLCSILQACMHSYKYDTTEIDMRRERIRYVWQTIIAFVHAKQLVDVVATMCLLQLGLQYNRLYEEIAVDFIQDVFALVGPNCTAPVHLTGAVSRVVGMRMTRRIPDIVITRATTDDNDHDHMKYSLHTTLYTICKTNRNIADYLDRRALTNLTLYKQITHTYNNGGHIVYDILTYFLKDRPHMIYC
jgi:hypothetical protein